MTCLDDGISPKMTIRMTGRPMLPMRGSGDRRASRKASKLGGLLACQGVSVDAKAAGFR
jgi:hypothetical protein